MSTKLLSITHPLSEQELSGIINTSLSTAFHALLGNMQGVRFAATAEMLETLVPNKPEYMARTISIADGQRMQLTDLIHLLVDRGYTRYYKKTREYGFFVQGDEITVIHPSTPDALTIAFFGNTVDKIVLEQDRRTTTLHSVNIFPLAFPNTTQPLKEILSDFELLDQAPVRLSHSSPISRDRALSLIGRLTPGRLAVHTDHGIGIYEGIEHRTVNGVESDYILLRYAEGDSISVPIPFAHKVSPYIGDKPPAVYRLGGTLWSKTKRRAKEDAAAFAKELLEITRKRDEATRSPYILDQDLEREIASSFGFELTPDQLQAWQEVQADLMGNHPMDRLIVGDVGFGKTELAIRAARHLVANGKQVALLAPTTLLVQQHIDTFRSRLPDIKDSIFLLSRFSTSQEIAKAKATMRNGKPLIAIGTHALLGHDMPWKNLSLLIIDEEQRFGVKQKEYFKKLRSTIDIMSLSATPIPRTLSMALSGLRSLSVIATAPQGRKDIETFVHKESDKVIKEAIEKELSRDGQVYFVSPKIRNLSMIAETVRGLVPRAKTAIAHAKLPDEELSGIIHAFDTKEINVLISSSIVENGLDLPNANTMIVWNAPHFGLAQLYQLRGRIGRRSRQGYAYFLYSQEKLTQVQRMRLTALTEASRVGSGWEIARRDLEIRGAGNMLGSAQSGSAHEVGMQLYLDMVDGVEQEERADIRILLPSFIPPSYIPDIDERTAWYIRLSRSRTIQHIAAHIASMQDTFGTLPEEVINLTRMIKLEIAATTAGVMKITTTRITPSDEDEYVKIECMVKDPLKTLQKLSQLKNEDGSPANWTVRDHALSWKTGAITAELVDQLTKVLI